MLRSMSCAREASCNCCREYDTAGAAVPPEVTEDCVLVVVGRPQMSVELKARGVAVLLDDEAAAGAVECAEVLLLLFP